MRAAVARLIASVAGAAALTLLVYAALPSGLDVRTDIVGYPTFANFDIDRYFWMYGLVVVFLPVVAIGLYVVSTRLLVGRLGPWRPLPAPQRGIEVVPELESRRAWAVPLGRTLFVGVVVGLEAAISSGRGWETMAAVGALYAMGVFLVGLAVSRTGRSDRIAVASGLNTLATPFLVAGVWAVSRSTEIEVASSGEVHGYDWLPAWAAVAASAAVLVVVVVALRRRAGRTAIQGLERVALLLVAAPVLLFLVMASLPGELGTFDSYEEGQAVAGAQLVRDGAFPWRDLMISHGLLYDVARGMLGFAVFDESRWGLVAADEVLLVPLAWVALYYLCAYLFWTNWVFLLGTQLLVVAGVVTAVETRLLLVPVVFLLLAALLEKPSVSRAVAFTGVLFVQVIVTPEALVVAVAAFVALAAYEVSYRRKDSPLGVRYRRIVLCLGTALGLAVVWSLFLAAFGALDDWAFGIASVVPGHRLTGGFPLVVEKSDFQVVAPIAALLVVYAFVAARVRLRRPFAYQDWLLVAMGLLTMLYYAKFLSRADGYHLGQSFSVAVPLLFYLAFRGITYCEGLLARLGSGRGWTWFPGRHSLTIPVAAVLLVAAASEPLYDVIDGAPRHFAATVSREPEVQGIGYTRPGEDDVATLDALADVLDSLVTPGDTVFDFSNAPGVFHYLLDLEPSTRYYHVSFAIRERNQSDLVSRLEASPAAAVVVGTERAFNDLPSWDGIVNQVRHYDVSEHLLDEYVPVSAVDGFVLMAPRGSAGAVDRELYFRGELCDWGYAPNFLSNAPAEGAESLRLPLRRSPDGKRLALMLPPDAAGYSWLEMRSGALFAEGRFDLTDRPDGDPRRSIAFGSLAGGTSALRVKVGSCSQWHGYRPGVVYLTSSEVQDIDRVRLVR